VALRDTATSLTDHALVEPVRFAFRASDALEVTQVMPISDTNGVDLRADVTVMFTRPVVALTTLAQQSTLPQPISINPPLAGTGEWLNTSIYVFHPQRPLTTNTTYSVTVRGGLTDVTGTALRHAYQWSFTTRPPGLIYAAPGDGAVNVWPDRALEVRFSQPMDRASVEAAFALHASSGQNVTGTFNWISDTLFFTPTHWFGRGTPYTWQFNGVVRSADGGHLEKTDPWTFTTTLPLTVTHVEPADGATQVEPYTSMYIQFSAPISVSTLANNIKVEPSISLTEVYTYYSRYDSSYYFGFSPQPSTTYTVTLKRDITNIWGVPLEAEQVIHFATGIGPGQSRWISRLITLACVASF
jgi:alpha-2-macroglobulin